MLTIESSSTSVTHCTCVCSAVANMRFACARAGRKRYCEESVAARCRSQKKLLILFRDVPLSIRVRGVPILSLKLQQSVVISTLRCK